MSTSPPVASFHILALLCFFSLPMRVICSGPQQDQDTEGEAGVGWGRGRREPRQKMTDKMCDSRQGGEAEERKVDFAAQCQDPKNKNLVFLLLLSEQGIFSLSWKTFGRACLAAAASLAWLQKCFPLHLSGQQTQEKKKWNARPLNGTCRTRVALYFYNQRGLACLGCSAGLQGGVGQARQGVRGAEQGIIVVIIFFFLNNPTNSSICLHRKCRRSDVGRCCRPNARPAPAAVQGRDVSRIYIYIYIYLYIYAFPFPVSHQGQYVAAGTSVFSWRIQNEGPFFTVLWLGLDQKRQQLFTEVRIPEARGVAGRRCQGRRRTRRVSNFCHSSLNTWQEVVFPIFTVCPLL